MSHFYTPRKRRKTIGFLTFSGRIEMRHWTKMGQRLMLPSFLYDRNDDWLTRLANEKHLSPLKKIIIFKSKKDRD